MYNLVGKFLQKAIPIKGTRLSIVKGLNNRVSTPKAPYVVLQITDQKSISSSETRYTDKYKILWSMSQVSINIFFIGNDNIPALQMSNAFSVRLNDAWASEQFEQYSDIFFPLYSDDIKIEGQIINSEDQADDACSVIAYFEYHPELGICENSAKEIIMDVSLSDK